jgi:hypothetical protein
MTDQRIINYHNFEALRAMVAFMFLFFIVATCVDYGYYQAQKFNIEGNINLAVMTGVEVLPDTREARTLVMSMANSQGVPVEPWEVSFDSDHRWLQVDKSDNYRTMFLKYIGVRQIPINVHVFDYKPGI